jgi:hypothetical protein
LYRAGDANLITVQSIAFVATKWCLGFEMFCSVNRIWRIELNSEVLFLYSVYKLYLRFHKTRLYNQIVYGRCVVSCRVPVSGGLAGGIDFVWPICWVNCHCQVLSGLYAGCTVVSSILILLVFTISLTF